MGGCEDRAAAEESGARKERDDLMVWGRREDRQNWSAEVWMSREAPPIYIYTKQQGEEGARAPDGVTAGRHPASHALL